MNLNFGGVQLSTSDSSHSSLIIFLRGCPYRCQYCQNKHLQSGENIIDSEKIKEGIKNYSSLISMIIFSGGESLLQPQIIQEFSVYSHSLGLKIGIETSGYNSKELLKLIQEHSVDQVFLDVKTFGQESYKELTGSVFAWNEVIETIYVCLDNKVPLEIRTTIFEDYPLKSDLEKIENLVKEWNLKWKKQKGHI